MVEPRKNIGCSLIGPGVWRGREGKARKRGDRHKREERNEGGMTGLLSAWLHVHKPAVGCICP